MEVVILYDNEACQGFHREWGFSCLIDRTVLFDTGADKKTLEYNIVKSSIDVDAIQAVVLSHLHLDHIGGIDIVDELGQVDVFLPPTFPEEFKKQVASKSNVDLVEVVNPEIVADSIMASKPIGKNPEEIGLFLICATGIVVVTGCAHFGLEKFIERASEYGEVVGVLGGFHGFRNLDLLEDMELIVPLHCTSKKVDILMRYPETSVRCGVGSCIKIDDE